MDVDAAHAQLREISDRQRQAVTAGQRQPWWFITGLLALLVGLILAMQWVDNPWIALAVTAGALVGIGTLSLLLVRRQPVRVHPTRYVRSRRWLVIGGSTAGGAVAGLTTQRLVVEEGLVGGLVGVAVVVVMMVVAQQLCAWTLRRPPTAPTTGTSRMEER